MVLMLAFGFLVESHLDQAHYHPLPGDLGAIRIPEEWRAELMPPGLKT